jgi:DNA-binding CsgD family transcriptional regulator
MTPSDIQRLVHDLAEISLEAASASEFRGCALERLARTVGFDLAAMTHARSSLHMETDGWGVPRGALDGSLRIYLAEFDLAEWKRALVAHTISDKEMFATERQEQFICYNDFLRPARVHGFRCQAFVSKHGFSWMTFARSGPGRSEFDADAIRALDAATPTLAIGEALHASRAPDHATVDRRERTREYGVTAAEYAALELIERGLTTEEIAQVLGRSRNTIRNQLASLFRKMGVSTRTELSYVFANPTQQPRSSLQYAPFLTELMKSVRCGTAAPTT